MQTPKLSTEERCHLKKVQRKCRIKQLTASVCRCRLQPLCYPRPPASWLTAASQREEVVDDGQVEMDTVDVSMSAGRSSQSGSFTQHSPACRCIGGGGRRRDDDNTRSCRCLTMATAAGGGGAPCSKEIRSGNVGWGLCPSVATRCLRIHCWAAPLGQVSRSTELARSKTGPDRLVFGPVSADRTGQFC